MKFSGQKILSSNPWIIVFIILAVGATALMYIDIKKEMRLMREDVLKQVFEARD